MAGKAACSSWNSGDEDVRQGNDRRTSASDLFSALSSSRLFLGQQTSHAECVAHGTSLLQPKASEDASSGADIDQAEFEFSYWHRLPDVVLYKVYTFLKDRDVCNASATCTLWRLAYWNPRLWASRHFVFTDTDAMKRADRYDKYLEYLGTYLRVLSVELPRPHFDTADCIAHAFEQFVVAISKHCCVGLLHFKLVHGNFSTGWEYFSQKKIVIHSLCTLLKKQKNLRSVDMSNCHIEREEGYRVLGALQCYSTRLHAKSQLRDINLQQFFAHRAQPLGDARYNNIMSLFPALVSLRVDMKCLSVGILHILAQSSHPAFRRLVFDFYVKDTNEQGITPECWKTVTRKLSDLRVVVYIHGLCGFSRYVNVLSTGMPLTELHVDDDGAVNLQQADHAALSSLLVYVAKSFSATLTMLSVQLQPYVDPRADSAVVKLLGSCPFLTVLRLNMTIQAITTLHILEAIRSLKKRREKAIYPYSFRISPKKVQLYLQVRAMTPGLDKTIKTMTRPISYDECSSHTPFVSQLISPPTTLNVEVYPSDLAMLPLNPASLTLVTDNPPDSPLAPQEFGFHNIM